MSLRRYLRRSGRLHDRAAISVRSGVREVNSPVGKWRVRLFVTALWLCMGAMRLTKDRGSMHSDVSCSNHESHEFHTLV